MPIFKDGLRIIDEVRRDGISDPPFGGK